MKTEHTDALRDIIKRNTPPKKQKIVIKRIQARDKMNDLQTSLSYCSIAGNVVYLPRPDEYQIPNYQEVRAALMNAGAAYKRNTFEFPNDAQPYIDRLMGGESVNIKKEFQFFATPANLADDLVRISQVNGDHSILEPSAGQGAIVKAIIRRDDSAQVHCYELMEINRSVLAKIPDIILLGNNFLDRPAKGQPLFDRIIANPPFSKNQDIDHIRKMYECLRPKGRIVTIASKHWQFADGKKETAFRQWLDEIGADIQQVDAGEFQQSGTMVGTVIIVIDK